MRWTLFNLLSGKYLQSITQWAIDHLGWREAYARVARYFGNVPTDVRREAWRRARSSTTAGFGWNFLALTEKPRRDIIPIAQGIDHAYEVKLDAIFVKPGTGETMRLPMWFGLDRLKTIAQIEDDFRDRIQDIYFYDDKPPPFLRGFELQGLEFQAVWRKWY